MLSEILSDIEICMICMKCTRIMIQFQQMIVSFMRLCGSKLPLRQEVDRQSFSEAHVLLSALHRGVRASEKRKRGIHGEDGDMVHIMMAAIYCNI